MYSQDEKERISNLGGEVIFWDGAYRVNGQLAVSRAIGTLSVFVAEDGWTVQQHVTLSLFDYAND